MQSAAKPNNRALSARFHVWRSEVRTIIAGSRECTDERDLLDAIEACGWTPTTVISGAARGADRLGEAWSARSGVPCERFPAEWDRHGRAAGFIRNEIMSERADALIALWDGSSRGTKHMIDTALRKGLRVYVHKISTSY